MDINQSAQKIEVINQETEGNKNRYSIADLLGKIRVYRAKLSRIQSDLKKYGAISSQELTQIGDSRDLTKNHNQTAEHIKSLYKQYRDIVNNILMIRQAIAEANNQIIIQVAGKKMTITQARSLYREITPIVRDINDSVDTSVTLALRSTERYNAQLPVNMSENAKNLALATVLPMVPTAELQKDKTFLADFLAEIESTLNSVNPQVFITLDLDDMSEDKMIF